MLDLFSNEKHYFDVRGKVISLYAGEDALNDPDMYDEWQSFEPADSESEARSLALKSFELITNPMEDKELYITQVIDIGIQDTSIEHKSKYTIERW